mmetsp:Transcript_5230/g.9965  ORF Transcript_5230/g.9965 Transcript_5230/m.9965 type:complete len:1602 (+) Transcript_5230:107-4912(+)
MMNVNQSLEGSTKDTMEDNKHSEEEPSVVTSISPPPMSDDTIRNNNQKVSQHEENNNNLQASSILEQNIIVTPETMSPPSSKKTSEQSSPLQTLLKVIRGEGDDIESVLTNSKYSQESKSPNQINMWGTTQPAVPPNGSGSPTRLGQASLRTVQTGHAKQTATIAQLSDSQKLLQKPLELGLNKEQSVALFAKPTVLKDVPIDVRESESSSLNGKLDNKRVSIHQNGKDGEQSIFEIDFESDSLVSNNIDPHHAGGFIDGNFSAGKLKEIETNGKCFTIKFNLDSTFLAVALCDGFGVELYETQQFRLIYTIERSATVSALDWVDEFEVDNMKADEELDFIKGYEERSQLLAVGGFDGCVKVYSISSNRGDLVHLLHTFYVQSAIYSLAFLKDNYTQYTPTPRAIVVGEKNGKVSIVKLPEYIDQAGTPLNGRVVDMEDSAILSISFGFIENGIIMVIGTKDGKLRARVLYLERNEWCTSQCLFELERTGAIRALRFNHDSSLLIVGGYDKTVLFIDTELWKIVRELYVEGTVQDIQYDPYNRYLLLGNRSKVMTVVDTSTLHPIKLFQTSGWVTSISWGGHSTIAMRSDEKQISLIMFEPIQPLGLTLDSTRGEDCSISWSADGRFLARTKGNDVIICDSKRDFQTVAKLSDVTTMGDADICRCVKFCHAKGKRDRLAIVGHDGYLKVISLRVSVGKVHQQLIASIFVEKNMKSVAWSPDGSILVCGGREMKLHMLDTSLFKKYSEPIDVGGRIWNIESLSQAAYNEIGEYSSAFCMSITTGRNVCSILDLESRDISMEITRKRTVRCQKYHPTLPVLAIGDASSEVMIVDLVGERKLFSFMVEGRVNTIAFSPAGDYIAVGTDEGTFTIHDTRLFKCVQEIRCTSMAMAIEFSGKSAQFLAISHANGDVKIVKLGPLLSIDYVPLHGTLDFPSWAKDEIMYRSPEGPSLLQRCMLDGSKESLSCAEGILDEAPESVLTFDRTTGVGCFETAVELRKPNIMKLILTPVVDGSLDSRSQWSSSLLTTTIPIDGFLTLRDLILNHPSRYATDILNKMTFMKVPFAPPKRCCFNDDKARGSDSYTDPWQEESKNLVKQGSRSFRLFSEHKDEVILIPAVLPLPGLGSLDFLSALLAMPNTGSEVFDNGAMGLVLTVLWNAGIKHYFFVDFILNVIFCSCWINFVDRSASSTSSIATDTKVVTILAWSVILINIIFTAEQGIRFLTRRGHFFRSNWHIVEVVCIVLVYVYCAMVLMDDREDNSIMLMTNSGQGNVPLAVITTLFLTVKFVSMLRGFDVTGYLVAYLLQSFIDVRGFVVVIISILIGFTVAFRLLLANVPGECKAVIEDDNVLVNDCDGDPFGNLSRAILSTFELTIMGSYDPSILYDGTEIFLVSIVFVVAVTVILVVALNALIAVLGDSFSRVQEKVAATRQRERAELIVEYMSMMPLNHRKRIEVKNLYFHSLLDSDGHGDLLIQKDDWQGGLNALKKELTEIAAGNNTTTQRAMDNLRNELSEEFRAMIQNEVTSVLNNVFLELKEISKFRQMSIRTRKVANAALAAQAIGGNIKTPFDGIKKNIFRDDRSHGSSDISDDEHGYESTLISI